MPTPRRSHADMKAETRAGLLAAARASFTSKGYAATSMDELCADAGLTRGALYHHFGGKSGLFEAVVRLLDHEMGQHLDAHYQSIADPWDALCACNIEYLRMALRPELQRVLFRDAPAVLGQRLRELDEESSIAPLMEAIEGLQRIGRIAECDPETVARMLNGALIDAALWIAAADDPDARFAKAAEAMQLFMDGLNRDGQALGG